MSTIGYDVSILEEQRLTGVEKLAMYLYSHLWEIATEDQHILFCRSGNLPFQSIPANVKIQKVKGKKFWRYKHLPQSIRLNKCEIFLSPVAALPGFCSIPKLAYIHECPWLHNCAEKVSWKDRVTLWISALRAKVLLTNSASTMNDIHRELPFSPKIEIISPAADPFSNTQEQLLQDTFKRYNIPSGKYCLFVSTIRPKKNVELLINTFRQLTNINLVCAGKIQDKNITSGKPSNVFFTDYVSQEELFTLYKHASCFLYISRNEGFGIPILEAFSNHCPVIASKCGSIPEVAGDAAYYIEDWNINILAKAISKVINDGNLQKTMIEKGILQAEKYTWHNSAKHLYTLIQKLT
ncbi:glycosyltransferase family 4 protein [Candidatus Uabimicrobium sp. HlEnr_7]|uniref:glycosyltransferase family 4 protein n=1 Tax=Candidatus Uabimicrobium helgolandensis TaxID=3095367 RepID=UPI003558CB58